MEHTGDLKKIKTARYFQAINNGAKAGFDLLVYKTEHSDYENSKFCIYQNIASREIEMISDTAIAQKYETSDEYKCLIGWTSYYPFTPKSPIAAYLIPADLQKDEKVLLEDWIDGITPNESKIATWNGESFDLL